MPDRALVIVPTYNERFNIARLIPAILAQDPSLEATGGGRWFPRRNGAIVDTIAANNPRVHVIHRAEKLGLGTAYIAGFEWALERKYDLVFEMDADFSHNPERLPEFLAAIREADVVLGIPLPGWSRERGKLADEPGFFSAMARTSTHDSSPDCQSSTRLVGSSASVAMYLNRSI